MTTYYTYHVITPQGIKLEWKGNEATTQGDLAWAVVARDLSSRQIVWSRHRDQAEADRWCKSLQSLTVARVMPLTRVTVEKP